VSRRRLAIAATLAVLAVLIATVARDRVELPASRQIRPREARIRYSLLEMLRPVALTNCQFERFGEAHDGGYLMCGNLLGEVQSAYSYGIAGYDKWGCDMSSRLKVRLHQYDCFDTTEPACPAGDTVFHSECVGHTTRMEEGRFFDTIANQLARNGDSTKRVVMKIDVEGAEWDSLLHAPEDVLDRIDQMAVEFHRVPDEKAQAVVQKLKELFHVAHVHFNNSGCIEGLDPFPSWAYEVLFVSKRLGIVDPSRTTGGLHPLDAPNNPAFADCQPKRH
jgi:hypothetical protein